MQGTFYFYYYYTLVKNQRLRHVFWNDIQYAAFSTHVKCHFLCGYVSMHFVSRPVFVVWYSTVCNRYSIMWIAKQLWANVLNCAAQ